MSCNCKARPSRQGSKYCQNCLPDEMQWLVPVSQTPDPFLMDTNHAYITPDNKVWVLSHDRTRAYAINGSVLDNLDITQFARVEDIIKYTAGKGIRIEGNVISSTVDLTPIQNEVNDIVTKVETNRITLDTLKTLVETLANKNKDYLPGENITISNDRVISADLTPLTERIHALEVKPDKDTVYDDTSLKARVTALEEKPDNDTIYDDTSVRERLTVLESKPDKDTKYTAGTNVTISQDNVISVDFQELLTRLQQANVFNEEQQQAINELKEATKRIRVYKKGQGIDITEDLTINGWGVTKVTQGVVENFTFVSPTGEEITLAHDTRKPTAGEGILLGDNWQISVDLSKVATKQEVNQAKAIADQAKLEAQATERKLNNFIENYTDNDTVYDDTDIKNRLVALENKPDIDTQYKAGANIEITPDNVINAIIPTADDKGPCECECYDNYISGPEHFSVRSPYADHIGESSSLTYPHLKTYIDDVLSNDRYSNRTSLSSFDVEIDRPTSTAVLEVNNEWYYSDTNRGGLSLPESLTGKTLYFSVDATILSGAPRAYLRVVQQRYNETEVDGVFGAEFYYHTVAEKEIVMGENYNDFVRNTLEFTQPEPGRDMTIYYTIVVEGDEGSSVRFDRVSLSTSPCYKPSSSDLAKTKSLLDIAIKNLSSLTTRVGALQEALGEISPTEGADLSALITRIEALEGKTYTAGKGIAISPNGEISSTAGVHLKLNRENSLSGEENLRIILSNYYSYDEYEKIRGFGNVGTGGSETSGYQKEVALLPAIPLNAPSDNTGGGVDTYKIDRKLDELRRVIENNHMIFSGDFDPSLWGY